MQQIAQPERALPNVCALACLSAAALWFLTGGISAEFPEQRQPLSLSEPPTLVPLYKFTEDFDFFDGRAEALLSPLQPPLQNAGVLPGAYRSHSPLPRRREDLPRIFPERRKTSAEINPTTVCVFAHTARQRSLFSTNVLGLLGSGRFAYKVMDTSFCQLHGTCTDTVSAAAAPVGSDCDGSRSPIVMLLERIKNFGHGRFNAVLRNGVRFWDVVVVTGDEFCRAHTPGTAHFRMYHGPEVVRSAGRPNLPDYIPLGPREEFERVSPAEVKLASERSFEVNFIGSWTSMARDRMAEACERLSPSVPKFVKLLGNWKKELTTTPGFIKPEKYREVLLDSVFTLCPQGHNPEAYRMFEACEAGSIPIVAMDAQYRGHECGDSYGALRDSGAPFVFLPDWADLPTFLDSVRGDPETLQRMQASVMAWYAGYMADTASRFESLLEERFRTRNEWNFLPPDSVVPECTMDNGVPCRDPSALQKKTPKQRCFGRC